MVLPDGPGRDGIVGIGHGEADAAHALGLAAPWSAPPVGLHEVGLARIVVDRNLRAAVLSADLVCEGRGVLAVDGSGRLRAPPGAWGAARADGSAGSYSPASTGNLAARPRRTAVARGAARAGSPCARRGVRSFGQTRCRGSDKGKGEKAHETSEEHEWQERGMGIGHHNENRWEIPVIPALPAIRRCREFPNALYRQFERRAPRHCAKKRGGKATFAPRSTFETVSS